MIADPFFRHDAMTGAQTECTNVDAGQRIGREQHDLRQPGRGHARSRVPATRVADTAVRVRRQRWVPGCSIAPSCHRRAHDMNVWLGVLRDLFLFRRGPADVPYAPSLLPALFIAMIVIDALSRRAH